MELMVEETLYDKTSVESIVAFAKKLTNKTLEEFGMSLIKKPKKPNSYPFIIKVENNHRDWKWFLY